MYIKYFLSGYADAKEWWLSAYETEDIEQQFEVLWDGILPLYEQLHAYIRRLVKLIVIILSIVKYYFAWNFN